MRDTRKIVKYFVIVVATVVAIVAVSSLRTDFRSGIKDLLRTGIGFANRIIVKTALDGEMGADYKDLWVTSNSLDRALMLMSKVNADVILALPESTVTIRFYNILNFQELTEKKVKGYCDTYALHFIALLRAAGIPARYVYLSPKKSVNEGTLFDTHTAVEALIGNKWIYLDPTFNLYFVSKEDALSVEQILELTKEEFGQAIVENGMSKNDYKAYYVPYESHFDFVDIYSFLPFESRQEFVRGYPDHSFSWVKTVSDKQRNKQKL